MVMKKQAAAGELSAETKTDINLALKKIGAKQSLTAKYYLYYDGKHRIKYASDKFKDKFGDQIKEYRENLCRVVVTTPADRLQVDSFTDEKQKSVSAAAWEIWKYSSMPRLAARIHRAAFKTGDAFVTVWADSSNKARIYPEDSQQCAVWYDPETQKVQRGAKLWRNELDEKFYLTIYYQDRIEKFITRASYKTKDLPGKAEAFEVRQVAGESPEDLANPSGVCPMFHFGLESSILDDVIPLNDALNKQATDLLVSSESNSRRERWTTGITYPKDPETGKPIIPFTENEQYKTTAEAGAKFGDFAQVALSEFLEALKYFGSAIARVTGIPSYYFDLEKSAPPSGESLVKAETRFTALIQNAQNDFGESWSSALAFALWIENQAGAVLERNLLQVNWTAANPQTKKEIIEEANAKKNLGVDDKTLQGEIGYSDADIIEIEQRKKEQDDASAARNKKMFDAGDPLGV